MRTGVYVKKLNMVVICGKTSILPDVFKTHFSTFAPSSGQHFMKQRRGRSVLGFIAMDRREGVHVQLLIGTAQLLNETKKITT